MDYLRKYFIMGSQNCPRRPEDILTEAIEAGITVFQYREKGPGSLQGEEKIALGKKLRAICREHDIPFIVNDDVELAATLDADGIHVGQEDDSVEDVRERFPDLYIGLSISNEEELKASSTHLVDYIGAGAIFPTSTKGVADPGVGVEWIRQLKQLEPDTAIVGIGGINPENAAEVIEAGADGVAVVSAITESEDIGETVKSL